MNCIELFTRHAEACPSRTALLIPGEQPISYDELKRRAGGVQALLRSNGLRAGDSILVFDQLNYRLYASIMGMLAAGITVELIEPWMPAANIERIVLLTKPKAFWCNWIGRLWGCRVRGIRNIPKWISPPPAREQGQLSVEGLAPEHPGIITFTSGTTGDPKGVPRTHGYLETQHRVISHAFDSDRHAGPDLCIFANFALTNLASGRTSVLVPTSWKTSTLERIDALPATLQPVTATCGPAFLLKMLKHARLRHLEHAHIGGALTDCWIFDEAHAKWPQAQITHVYGSSEVEPVAYGDAREMVNRSRARGLFQTLALGHVSPELLTDFQPDGLWVSGPHVCPRYVGNDEENQKCKRTDAQGRLWHLTGDRIDQAADTLWYHGRSGQQAADFDLEQSIYKHACSSTSFIHRTPKGERVLIACRLEDTLKSLPPELRSEFSRSIGIARIRRDRRHRSRIDRAATIKKEVPERERQWLLAR